jgi:general stress protein 26
MVWATPVTAKTKYMDSINRQQPEENRKDLGGKEGVEKIRELVEKAGACFFSTKRNNSKAAATRPMAVQEIDDEGCLWMLSASDSHKNAEISADPFVQLYFQGSSHSDFLTLSGRAEISTDKEKIKKLWNPILKTWFTEGENDPRITVIKITPEDGYYWDTKHGMMVAFAKRVAGAITGQTLDDSIEGKIRP